MLVVTIPVLFTVGGRAGYIQNHNKVEVLKQGDRILKESVLS